MKIDGSLADPHLRLLGLSAGEGENLSLERLKRAYHRSARANHPDLFPDAERQKRELAMMRINEAYITLIELISRPARRSEHPPQAPTAPPADPGAVGPLKDPDYVYYKRGLENYREGQRRFFDRRNAAGRPQHYVPDSQLLQLAIAALRHFQKAYAYFYRVVNDYPDSIWVSDSRFRLWRIEQYNRVYTRICRVLADKVSADNQER